MFFSTTIIDTKWRCGNRPLTKIKETRRFNGMTCIDDVHCKYHDEEKTRKEREKKKDERGVCLFVDTFVGRRRGK